MNILDKLFFWRRRSVIEFDDKDGVVYTRDDDGFERWWMRNADGKATHFIDSRGYERWWKYDENGEIFLYRESTGYEWFSNERYRILFRRFDLPK